MERQGKSQPILNKRDAVWEDNFAVEGKQNHKFIIHSHIT